MKVNYSTMETQLLNLLRNATEEKALTLSQLAQHIYNGDAPRHPRSVIRGTLVRLGGKLKTNREGVAIWHTPRRGPHEVGYWAE